MELPDAPLRFRVHAAPIARFGGHVFGGIALFILIALGAAILGWLIDLLSTVTFSLWGLNLVLIHLLSGFSTGLSSLSYLSTWYCWFCLSEPRAGSSGRRS